MTDTNVKKDKKSRAFKSLALIGFIGLIILIAWLSVQLAQKAPNAFSSLASLVESLNNNESSDKEEPLKELTVTSDRTLVNTKETVTLTWSPVADNGSYVFSYDCTDGVAIDLLEEDTTRAITCDTNYNIGNVTSLTIKADSEKTRFAELRYSISYIKPNAETPTSSGTAQITVLNSTISDLASDEATSTDQTTTDTTDEPSTNTDDTTSNQPTTPPSVNQNPTYTQEYIYAIPTSDPKGKIDLSVKYLGTGQIINNKFTALTPKQGQAGAVQFEVKNYGTKTSGSWVYRVSLPNGDIHTSPTQVALKPNERAVITLGFPSVSESRHTFVIQVNEKSDSNSRNDKATAQVSFSR
jgi:hypothetical protein